MGLREKPYDIAQTSDNMILVYRRREEPDGLQRFCKRIEKGWKYPWNEMEDGDWFIVPVTGSEQSMKVAFYQAAARHDIEISIHKDADDNSFRVTRVQSGIRKLKKRAASKGAKVKVSDLEAYYERQSRWRRERGIYASPTPTPGGVLVGSRPSSPGSDGYDRRAALEAARRRAAEDLKND